MLGYVEGGELVCELVFDFDEFIFVIECVGVVSSNMGKFFFMVFFIFYIEYSFVIRI